MTEVEDLGGDISSCVEVQEKTTNTETPPSVSQASGLTVEKRLRALKKKLQQIEALKEKRELGQVLEKTQVSLEMSCVCQQV